MRRRLPPRGGGRRPADRRAAGADARHEPPRHGDRARALPPLRQARARRLDVGGLRRPPRGAAARGDAIGGSTGRRRRSAGRTPTRRRWTSSSRSRTTGARPRLRHRPALQHRRAAPERPVRDGRSRRFVQRALAGEPLEIHGDGEQTRCFCHVADTIRALAGLMEHGRGRARSTTSARRSASRSTALAERVHRAHRLVVGDRVRRRTRTSTGSGSRTCSTASRRRRRSGPRSAGSPSARSTDILADVIAFERDRSKPLRRRRHAAKPLKRAASQACGRVEPRLRRPGLLLAQRGKRITSRIVSRPERSIDEPVDPEPEAAGRRHAVRERLDVVRVAALALDVLRLHRRSGAAAPPASLISVNALPSSIPPAKYSNRSVSAGSSSVDARERRELDRVVVDDRRLDQARLDEVGERVVDELRPVLVGVRVHAALLEPGAELRLVARPELELLERVDEANAAPRRASGRSRARGR